MEWLKDRVNILKLIIGLICFILISRLFFLQVVNGYDYYKKSINIVFRQLPISASRGDIVDTYGRKIAVSNPGYVVKFDAGSNINDEKVNTILLRLVKILEKHKEKYTDNFPITHYPYKFSNEFDKNATFSAADFYKLSKDTFDDNWTMNINYDKNYSHVIFEFTNTSNKVKKYFRYTPNQIIRAFCQRYHIKTKYKYDRTRDLIGFRYEIEQQNANLKSFEPIVLANDVKLETISEIEENHNSIPGVLIEVAPIREYSSAYLMDSPIVGYVGKMTAEQYAKVDKSRYKMSDIYGETGIEKYAEQYLKGHDGSRFVEADSSGRKKREIGITNPKKGNTVVLTIDNKLQQAAEYGLKSRIAQLNAQGIAAKAGAVVAVDVHTGEVLALVTYPYFDSNDFINGISQKKWNQLQSDKRNPMMNRAIQGAYPPGSTFKILTAIAGLQDNKIGPYTTILDQGRYAKTGSECWLYREQGRTHGYVNVSDAIKVSCNYFFYEVGDMLGIKEIDRYGKMFGLGSKTGIELDNEVSGILSSPEAKQKIKKLYAKIYPNYKYDANWYLGNTVTTAIGQDLNVFTPVQMANYVSTVANGGTRYQLHLIKEVISPDGRIIMQNKPKVMNKINIRPENLAAVFRGMGKVTEDGGTGGEVFSGFPIHVGGKTGSATYDNNGNAHAWFIGFAPYNNPQIAVACFIETGQHGANAAYPARDVLAAYFGINTKKDIDPINYSQGLITR